MAAMRSASRKKKEINREESPFQVDVRKILHSKAYARYADKTQVVYLFPHDHISSRGLHVQLVSFFARSIGTVLGLNNDLIEAISLGHDMGHAPFGHEGELYLNELSIENGCGSFSHARQSCRIAEYIENLNLTLGVLDGFLTHDGGLQSSRYEIDSKKSWKRYEEEMEKRLSNPEGDFCPMTFEAALVKVCDTTSYVQRDVLDALTLGIVKKEMLPKTCFGKNMTEITNQVKRDVIESFTKKKNLSLSKEVFQGLQKIREFNFEHIYRHKQLKTESKKIHAAYRLLYYFLLNQWKHDAQSSILWKYFLRNKQQEYLDKNRPEQSVIDYIAGMTDGYFLRLFESLYLPKTIVVPDVLPFS